MSLSVAVLAGGLSLEREVSLLSGGRVVGALTDRGYSVKELDLGENLVPELERLDIDVVFLALHGKSGEDGTIQSLLELLGIPYTGPDAISSSLAWDKAVCKGLWRRAGVPTADWTTLSSSAVRDMGAAHALEHVVGRLGAPVVVKPAQGGSSLGVRIVETPEALASALISSLSYHDTVVVEQFVSGTEVAVSVVADEALPPVEVTPKEGAYDYAARYTHGATEFFAPARLPDATLERCREVALEAYSNLGCRHVTRVDMVVTPEGMPVLLELNTCPGLTETSLLPMAAQAQGWEFGDLCERLVRLAAGAPA